MCDRVVKVQLERTRGEDLVSLSTMSARQRYWLVSAVGAVLMVMAWILAIRHTSVQPFQPIRRADWRAKKRAECSGSADVTADSRC
jgi:hypothetical protein